MINVGNREANIEVSSKMMEAVWVCVSMYVSVCVCVYVCVCVCVCVNMYVSECVCVMLSFNCTHYPGSGLFNKTKKLARTNICKL